MNNTPNDTYLIWKNSIPMHQAAITFATKDLRAKWESAQEVSAMKIFKDSIDAAPENGLKGMDLFMKSMEEPQKILQERSEIKRACEANILRYIQSEALQSFAFGAPRTIDASPIKLAPRVWSGTLKWHANTITHESLTFVEVRLINPYSIKKLLGSRLGKILPSSTPPTAGRPTIKNDVEEAFRSLFSAGKFDLEASVKSKCQDIRNWLIHFKPDGNYGPDKPKYDAIRKHLKPLVIAEKAKNS